MKRLTVGQRAPDFTAIDVDGDTVMIGSNPEKYVLLAFLRCAGCPWCNLAVHRLVMESKMLGENNCDIVVFAQSPAGQVLTNAHGHESVFPIVADPHKQFYRQYGVNRRFRSVVRAINDIPAWVHAFKGLNLPQNKLDGDLFLAQALFLVSCKTKKVVQALHGKSLYDHETFTPIYQSLIFRET
jgi:peroxiredoxin